MTRITLNEINNTMEGIPSKLLLVIKTIEKGNAETHQLLQTLIEEVQTSNRKQNNVVEEVLQTISNNSAGISIYSYSRRISRSRKPQHRKRQN